MLAQVPVLAANEGGPLETVVEGQTGWLRDIRKSDDWAAVMSRVITEPNPDKLHKMGENGRQRVRAEFSKEQMALRLDQSLDQISDPHKKPSKSSVSSWIWLSLVFTAIALLMAFGATKLLFFMLQADQNLQDAVRRRNPGASISEQVTTVTSQIIRSEL